MPKTRTRHVSSAVKRFPDIWAISGAAQVVPDFYKKEKKLEQVLPIIAAVIFIVIFAFFVERIMRRNLERGLRKQAEQRKRNARPPYYGATTDRPGQAYPARAKRSVDSRSPSRRRSDDDLDDVTLLGSMALLADSVSPDDEGRRSHAPTDYVREESRPTSGGDTSSSTDYSSSSGGDFGGGGGGDF